MILIQCQWGGSGTLQGIVSKLILFPLYLARAPLEPQPEVNEYYHILDHLNTSSALMEQMSSEDEECSGLFESWEPEINNNSTQIKPFIGFSKLDDASLVR
jgi:hypothetical protein